MLKVAYDKQKEELVFDFDIPIPSLLIENKELKLFLESFGKSHGRLVYGDKKELTALRLNIAGMKDFIFSSLSHKEAEFYFSILQRLVSEDKLDSAMSPDVNFHQKTFDTDYRYWDFILSQGEFQRYFFNRIGWYVGPVNGIVTNFPLHVDIETASTCNMNCPMCYRRMLNETGQMEPDLFYKIVDECEREGVFSIRLSWRGETLTHPKIQDLIAYACKRIPNVSFLTNAFYIDESIAKCLIDHNLSYVAVSFDGIGDVYEKIRAPAIFDESRNRVDRLKKLRENDGKKRPQIRLCTIWPAIKSDPDAYYKTMQPVSDYIVYNPYINFYGTLQIKPDFICQYPWERLVVAFNGETQCCTGWNGTDIILGNAGEKSLKSMWNSEEMEHIRRIHASGCRMDLESCRECRHGATGDSDVSIDDILERRW